LVSQILQTQLFHALDHFGFLINILFLFRVLFHQQHLLIFLLGLWHRPFENSHSKKVQLVFFELLVFV
jgi:hypothetical protein